MPTNLCINSRVSGAYAQTCVSLTTGCHGFTDTYYRVSSVCHTGGTCFEGATSMVTNAVTKIVALHIFWYLWIITHLTMLRQPFVVCKGIAVAAV